MYVAPSSANGRMKRIAGGQEGMFVSLRMESQVALAMHGPVNDEPLPKLLKLCYSFLFPMTLSRDSLLAILCNSQTVL